MKIRTLLISALILTYSVMYGQLSSDLCLDYFTSEYCEHCKTKNDEIKQLQIHYPDLSVNWYDVNEDPQNIIRLSDFYHEKNILLFHQSLPTLFIGTKNFIGDFSIADVESEIRILMTKSDIPCPEPLSKTSSEEGRQKKIDTLPLITIISAAVIDSINPCAIAVLLILLTALMASNEKKKAIRTGLAFTAAIYISYFLFGLGLFSAIRVMGLSYWFYKTVGFIAILIGLANIKDYFWFGGGGFVMEIPRKWRPKMKSLLSGVTSPWGAFAMGFVVCLFELPCTGGPYLFILGLLAEKSTRMQAIPILMLYNLFFVLPLLIISGLVYFGFTTIKDTDEWRDRNSKIFHLIIGIVMVILGILVVFEIL